MGDEMQDHDHDLKHDEHKHVVDEFYDNFYGAGGNDNNLESFHHVDIHAGDNFKYRCFEHNFATTDVAAAYDHTYYTH